MHLRKIKVTNDYISVGRSELLEIKGNFFTLDLSVRTTSKLHPPFSCSWLWHSLEQGMDQIFVSVDSRMVSLSTPSTSLAANRSKPTPRSNLAPLDGVLPRASSSLLSQFSPLRSPSSIVRQWLIPTLCYFVSCPKKQHGWRGWRITLQKSGLRGGLTRQLQKYGDFADSVCVYIE